MFAEDLAPFFSTSDFAVEALWKGSVTITGIYEAPGSMALEVGATDPRFICAASAVPGVRRGDTLAVLGSTYKVKSSDPDGTGVIYLELEAQ